MPAKRRRTKARRSVSALAQEIYRADPDGIEGNLIFNSELADELGREVLVAYPDLAGVIEQLSERRD